MARFAYTADVHLRLNAWVSRPSLSYDAEAGLAQVVDFCIAEKIPLVIGGDLQDSTTPPSEAVVAFKTQVDRMEAAGLPIFAVDGNHDGVSPSWLSLFDAVTRVDGQSFVPAGDIVAYGLSYRPPAQLQEDLANLPHQTELLVCHQLIDWAFALHGAFNMKAEWVPGFIKFVAAGDLHKPVEWTDERGITFAYPGSLAMQNLGEPSAKSFMVIEKRADGSFAFERVPIKTRQLFEISIMTAEQLPELVSAVERDLEPTKFQDLPEPLRTPILSVTYNDAIPGIVARIKAATGERAHLWTHPFTLDVEVAADHPPVDLTRSVESVLGSLVKPESNPMLFNFIRDLITLPDPAAVLDQMRQSLGVHRPGAAV
jgi:hypothetical protein